MWLACSAPLRKVSRRNSGCARRNCASPRTNCSSESSALSAGPVDPADLVVLAVGVVVALLRAIQLVAGQQHGHALREEQRGQQVAHLAAAQRDDRARRRWGLRRRSSSSGCDCGRRGCSSRLASLCRSLYDTVSRSVKPSCAATKLMLAVGLRPLRRNRSDWSRRSARRIRPACAGRHARTRAWCRDSDRSTPTSRAENCRAGSRRDPRPRARR